MIVGHLLEFFGWLMTQVGNWLVSLIPDAPPWPAVALSAWGTITETAGHLWWWCNFDAMAQALIMSAGILVMGFSLRMAIISINWVMDVIP